MKIQGFVTKGSCRGRLRQFRFVAPSQAHFRCDTYFYESEYPELMGEKRWFRKYPKLTIAAVVVTGALAATALMEGTLFLFLKAPVLNNYFPFFKSTVSNVYFNNYRNIIQLMPECARYDPELTYMLKPGECVMENIEYSNKYSVNSAGLRDDESSLVQPEIIVLGDSYAMGWGVEQNETFAQMIENTTGEKVLNAGVPSFGTAREVMLLKRLDLSNVKTVIIQYSANDFVENFAYVNDGFQLRIMTKNEYEDECRRHASRVRYSPFLLTSVFLSRVAGLFIRQAKAGQEQNTNLLSNVTMEVKLFLEILSRQNFPKDVQIIALNLSHYTLDIHGFTEQLSIWKKQDYPDFIKNMKLIDAAAFFNKSDYYIIDDHLNASGHRKVADALISVIIEN